MPFVDGVEATRRIRRLEGAAAAVPIVGLTANVMEADRRRCLEAGMQDCLGKPIDWGRLFAAMARHAGYEFRSLRIASTDHAGYYPNARPMHVKLVMDATNGRLLGGQIVGYEEVAKRADILAIALAAGWTVEELAWSDLTYAPPVSSVWDPVLVAAQALAKER